MKIVDQIDLPPGRRFFRVFGVRRSGNHAICEFISQRLDPTPVFLDQCKLIGDPFGTMTSVGFGGDVWSLVDKQVSTNGELLTRREARSKVQELFETERDVVAFFEEQITPKRNFIEMGHFHARAENIVVTRSLSNWLASSYSHINNFNPSAERSELMAISHLCGLAEIWLSHIEAARGGEKKSRIVSVKFDEFVNSPKARRELASVLGLREKGTELPGHSRFGRGSSFGKDGLEGPDIAETLRNRSKKIQDDEAFLRCLSVIFHDKRIKAAVQQFYPEDYQVIENLLFD